MSCSRARRRAPEATIQVADRPAVVNADPLRLEQALGNLIDNALRHGGRADRARGRDATGAVGLHVRDDGPGFPRRPAAFERFTPRTQRAGRGGAGLGLAIVDDDRPRPRRRRAAPTSAECGRLPR